MKYSLTFGRMVAPLVFLLLSAGCISVERSPEPRFYALQSMKEAEGSAVTGADSLGNAVVGIGPVTLPEYYNRPQIVTNNSDDTLAFAQFDRWAEPLNKALAGAISQNLSILLPKTNIEVFPWHSVIPVRYQVIMKIILLDCRLSGEALLRIQWSILDAQKKKILFSTRSDYRSPVKPHNYAGLVQAISAVCESASRGIALALTELAKK